MRFLAVLLLLLFLDVVLLGSVALLLSGHLGWFFLGIAVIWSVLALGDYYLNTAPRYPRRLETDVPPSPSEQAPNQLYNRSKASHSPASPAASAAFHASYHRPLLPRPYLLKPNLEEMLSELQRVVRDFPKQTELDRNSVDVLLRHHPRHLDLLALSNWLSETRTLLLQHVDHPIKSSADVEHLIARFKRHMRGPDLAWYYRKQGHIIRHASYEHQTELFNAAQAFVVSLGVARIPTRVVDFAWELYQASIDKALHNVHKFDIRRPPASYLRGFIFNEARTIRRTMLRYKKLVFLNGFVYEAYGDLSEAELYELLIIDPDAEVQALEALEEIFEQLRPEDKHYLQHLIKSLSGLSSKELIVYLRAVLTKLLTVENGYIKLAKKMRELFFPGN